MIEFTEYQPIDEVKTKIHINSNQPNRKLLKIHLLKHTDYLGPLSIQNYFNIDYCCTNTSQVDAYNTDVKLWITVPHGYARTLAEMTGCKLAPRTVCGWSALSVQHRRCSHLSLGRREWRTQGRESQETSNVAGLNTSAAVRTKHRRTDADRTKIHDAAPSPAQVGAGDERPDVRHYGQDGDDNVIELGQDNLWCHIHFYHLTDQISIATNLLSFP